MFESYELKRFGETLRKIRTTLSLTQQQVTDRTGIHIDTLRKIENGYSVPKFDTLTHLSSLYNINLIQVFIKAMTSYELMTGYQHLDILINHRQFSKINDLQEQYESIKNSFERYDNLIFKKELDTLKTLYELVFLRYNGTQEEKKVYCISGIMPYIEGSLFNIRNIRYSALDTLQMRLLLDAASVLSDLKYYRVSNSITLSIIDRLQFLRALSATDDKLVLKAYSVLTTSYHKANMHVEARLAAIQGIDLSIEMDALLFLPYFLARKGVSEYNLSHEDARQTLLDCIALSRIVHPKATYEIYKENGERFIALVNTKSPKSQ